MRLTAPDGHGAVALTACLARNAMDLTAAESSKIPMSSSRRIVFTGIGAGGYQTGEGECVPAHAPAARQDARGTHSHHQAPCLVPAHTASGTLTL